MLEQLIEQTGCLYDWSALLFPDSGQDRPQQANRFCSRLIIGGLFLWTASPGTQLKNLFWTRVMRGLSFGLTSCLLLATTLCLAQTTQGLITGRVRDQSSGAPIPKAVIEYEQLESNTQGSSTANADGYYYIPLLSPGMYRVRISYLENHYT